MTIKGNACVIAIDCQGGPLNQDSKFYDPEYVEIIKRDRELGRIPDKEPLIQKRRYSGFLYTELEVCLSAFGVHPNDTLILIGGFTDVCVHYTFVDAHQRDYRLRVVKDCVQPSTPKAGESALEAMRYLQHEAPVTFDEMMAELDEYEVSHKG